MALLFETIETMVVLLEIMVSQPYYTRWPGIPTKTTFL